VVREDPQAVIEDRFEGRTWVCIENRRETNVPKVSATWNGTGYAECTDLSVCNRGRRMFYLPKE